MLKRVILLAGLAGAIVLGLVLIDVLKSDEPFTWPVFLLDLLEKGLLAIGMAATAIIALEIRGLKRERTDLLDDLARARAEGERWRGQVRQHLEGLSKAISLQFAAWRLSAGEAEVAALLLKGLSHKEIARLRDTSEATVRQQAAAIYRKSGLGSRAELSAFFLEDLLAPMEDASARPPSGLTVVRER
jgi:DNA-binding CsgD family transcriptional regulator